MYPTSRVRVPPLRHARWALPLVLALLAGLGPTLPASGDTSSQLAKARTELHRLVSQIKGEEARASALRGQLAGINARIAQARTEADRIGAQLTTTRASLMEVRAEYQVLHDRLDQMAANEYMAGAGSSLEAILGATSFTDLFDRVQFVSDISRQAADIAAQLQNVAAILAQRSKDLTTLLSRQKRIIAQLAAQQQAKATAVADEAAALQQLDQTRTRIVALVARLEKRLRAEEIASIGRIFQGGSHISYGAWAGLFLQTLGASSCHSNMVAVVSWQVAEFTQAAWNPLATTYPMPGAGLFNGSGVRNYVSLSQGLEATRLTIRSGMQRFGYGRIVSALSACADPMSTGRAINESSWCRGCAGGTYVVGMVPKVLANYAIYAAL